MSVDVTPVKWEQLIVYTSDDAKFQAYCMVITQKGHTLLL